MTDQYGSDLDQAPVRRARVFAGIAAGVLIAIVLVFMIRRVFIDTANAGRAAADIDPNDLAYSEHTWLAYLHIVPGTIYLLGACLQLSARFRTRHYPTHRRMGRVVLVAGLVSGVFSVVFGSANAYGGWSESICAVVFGVWFTACLLLAYRAIRRGDPLNHRRWMVRAFVVAIGVGTIRIWIGLLAGTGLVALNTSFAIGFWLALVMHAAIAEWWLARTPRLAR